MQYQAREAMQSILEFETCLRTWHRLGSEDIARPKYYILTLTANPAGSQCDNDHDQPWISDICILGAIKRGLRIR